MAKYFLGRGQLQRWLGGLALYGHGPLWREVLAQAGRGRWGELAMAVALLWSLALLTGSFVLLNLGEDPGLWLPPGWLGLARWLEGDLGLATAVATPPGPWALGLVAAAAVGFWVAGSHSLLRLVGAIYGDRPTAAAPWRRGLLPWATTALGLGLAGLIFGLVGPGQPLAEAGPVRWGEHLARWGAALGLAGLGLAAVYRCTPQRWRTGVPLGPGVRLGLGLGLGLVGLRHWLLGWLADWAIAHAPLLALAINLLTLTALIALVPLGAQINISSLRYRSPAPHRPWKPTPPPSFDSFKINRRH